MRAWINVTDWQWFHLLAAQRGLEEINFWQPGGRKRFTQLEPGELFLFKLRSPRNFIVGGGVFSRSHYVTALAVPFVHLEGYGFHVAVFKG